jgi:Reverse transcriptase (RNA-dependent DNA polymerase)
LLGSHVTNVTSALSPSIPISFSLSPVLAITLKKALYGCKQSAVLWHNELKSTLSMGFVENVYDVCSFSRQREKSIDRNLVHVDDLLITSDDDAVLDDIDAKLRSKYGGVTSKKELVHEYLGIKWDFSTPGQVSLSMEGYINDIFAKHKVEKTYTTPANNDLFIVNEKSPELNNAKRESFCSIAMTLLYIT